MVLHLYFGAYGMQISKIKAFFHRDILLFIISEDLGGEP
jgi:hypothetical protein